MSRRVLGGLVVAIATIVLCIVVLAAPSFSDTPPTHGVSFSAPHAQSIGLDWREAYTAILDDLGVRHLRLAADRNEIEKQPGVYDFSDLDYQLDEAAERNAIVVLGVGRKLPRWPECHTPTWAKELPEREQQQRVLALLTETVVRYREHPAVSRWQLENEPLLDFGDCPPADHAFLTQEEELLRQLDSSHEIMITDLGELNSWIPASAYGDLLGTTMYRTVFSGRTHRPFHYDYLFPSWLYRLKARLVWLIHGKRVVISELQGEPWAARSFHEVTTEERRASFNPKRMKQLRAFAERTGLPEVYWWGAEYWYWEKEVNNEPVFWNMAKTYFEAK